MFLLLCQTYASAQPPAGAASADRTAPGNQPGYTPLTGRQQLKQLLRYTFSPTSVLGAAASAGWGQWRDRPYEWKEGGDGFGRRFASAYGAHLVRATLLYSVATTLHEDVRFTPLRSGSFGTRLGHAVGGAFTARHPDGSRHVSIARIAAFAGAALISRTWQPKSTAGWESAADSFATSSGTAIGIDVFREFWPHRQ